MLLAIETSCDETSAALIHQGQVRANVVSSQVRLHAEYGGVVPELAAREHLRNLMPVCQRALGLAKVKPEQLQAVAATQGPGLPSALMAGLKCGQALAFVLRRPFLGIHHHEAHLYSPWIKGSPPAADFSEFCPHVALIASGGHTLLVQVKGEMRHYVLGATLDDAAGECFDKVGKLMGLPYPAGPEIDHLAQRGNPAAYQFPRPMLEEPGADFSFSGLKTSVRYFLRDHATLLDDAQAVQDLCASLQRAIVDVLVGKTIRVALQLKVGCVTASGGVTCNRLLREDLTAACHREGLALRFAEKDLCTDNAAMIGILAERKLAANPQGTSLDADILPNWELE